jgi:isorenieratene synthase
MIDFLIKRKLKNYKIKYNSIDKTKDLSIKNIKSVVVIGSGLAGISAASHLAERGFKVTLFEKESFLGGKVGAWKTVSKDYGDLDVEHGFHAFFKQYYNLRKYLNKIDAEKNLIPISDYLIFFKDKSRLSFDNLKTTPLLNILDLHNKEVYKFSEFFGNLNALKMLDLLKYNEYKTFKKYDHVSFKEFSQSVGLSEKMQSVFNTFARAFFAEPEQMSMAELIKGFHFYFLSNDLGLVYDVLNDDFQISFLSHCQKYLEKYNVDIKFNSLIEIIEYKDNFKVNGQDFDYCILALDAKNIKPLVKNSHSLKYFNEFNQSISKLKNSNYYAVLKIWSTQKLKSEKSFFIFTDRVKCLDSVTFYHDMEKSSKDWSERISGGIYELHSYAITNDFNSEQEIISALLEEFKYYFPDFDKNEIVHQFFQYRNDFPAFHLNQWQSRPTVKTHIPNLYLAGDWVKIPIPAMLMEGAFSSGIFAANEILKQENLQEFEIESVPLKGLFA